MPPYGRWNDVIEKIFVLDCDFEKALAPLKGFIDKVGLSCYASNMKLTFRPRYRFF